MKARSQITQSEESLFEDTVVQNAFSQLPQTDLRLFADYYLIDAKKSATTTLDNLSTLSVKEKGQKLIALVALSQSKDLIQ